MQTHIANVATQLSQHVKQQASGAIVGAINDLIKHVRKCIQNLSEPLSPKVGSDSSYMDLQCALENCISSLSHKVGDVGPILDMMAVVLENIPASASLARTTMSALYRTAQLISSVPNVSYYKKAFPDVLFHHLLLAMSHPDHETRVLAHRVFVNVLMPSGNLPLVSNENQAVESLPDGKTISSSLRLSRHQVSLVLSSIWVQATMTGNTPENFEAMAQTYNLALFFTLSKNSNHMALIRCFQLHFL
ncbi:hypothetical protein HanRHA438_Chr03g0146401 [Helianthus annuus]|nr:hypothetical protein HanRHA438_Chr03g0146401 [Helianthus annuus]